MILLSLLFPMMAFAEVIPLTAQYSIPTTTAEEQSVNTFELKNYQVETFADGSAVMQFELPKAMVGYEGQSYHLSLVGKVNDKVKVLSGSNAKAVCEGPWRNMQCSLMFDFLYIDTENLLATLQQEFPENEVRPRYEMLMRFGTDPIGLAIIKAP